MNQRETNRKKVMQNQMKSELYRLERQYNEGYQPTGFNLQNIDLQNLIGKKEERLELKENRYEILDESKIVQINDKLPQSQQNIRNHKTVVSFFRSDTKQGKRQLRAEMNNSMRFESLDPDNIRVKSDQNNEHVIRCINVYENRPSESRNMNEIQNVRDVSRNSSTDNIFYNQVQIQSLRKECLFKNRFNKQLKEFSKSPIHMNRSFYQSPKSPLHTNKTVINFPNNRQMSLIQKQKEFRRQRQKNLNQIKTFTQLKIEVDDRIEKRSQQRLNTNPDNQVLDQSEFLDIQVTKGFHAFNNNIIIQNTRNFIGSSKNKNHKPIEYPLKTNYSPISRVIQNGKLHRNNLVSQPNKPKQNYSASVHQNIKQINSTELLHLNNSVHNSNDYPVFHSNNPKIQSFINENKRYYSNKFNFNLLQPV